MGNGRRPRARRGQASADPARRALASGRDSSADPRAFGDARGEHTQVRDTRGAAGSGLRSSPGPLSLIGARGKLPAEQTQVRAAFSSIVALSPPMRRSGRCDVLAPSLRHGVIGRLRSRLRAQKLRILLLRGPLASLRGARASPIRLICLGPANACAQPAARLRRSPHSFSSYSVEPCAQRKPAARSKHVHAAMRWRACHRS